MSKKNEIKVGDKVILNQDHSYSFGVIPRGAKGKVKGCPGDLTSAIYTVKFKGMKKVMLYGHRFDLIPHARKNSTAPAPLCDAVSPEPIKEIPARKEIPAEKEPVKRGIRIKVREVKPDVFVIVDFTALDWRDLPPEYRDGFPFVGIHDGYLRVSKSKDCHEGFCRGNFLTRVRLDKLVETCKEAGERLRIINNYPKKAFEVVI